MTVVDLYRAVLDVTNIAVAAGLIYLLFLGAGAKFEAIRALLGGGR